MTTTHADALAAEPFTLVLSAGFFGFYAHAGLLCALEQARVLPRRVVGTSAGAIAGGIWAAGVPSASMVELLANLRREDFWDPTWTGWSEPREASREGSGSGRGELREGDDPGTRLGLLRGRKFGALLRSALAGCERIEQCAIPFAAVTHELRARQSCVHERGSLCTAIRASAALPLMFGPVRIAGRLHADGGIGDRPGFSALASGERVLYHHLPHRSRWPRFSGDEAAERRDTDTRTVIVIDDLPRVHPGALERGTLVLERAREHTLRWLERPAVRSSNHASSASESSRATADRRRP
jgi:NTE family protein